MKAEIEQQFIAAYDSLVDPLYRHCLFRVHNSTIAEDLVQDCFMKTWNYLADGKEVENLRAFLYKVVNNLIIDYSRKRKEESLEAALESNPYQEPSVDGREQNDNHLLYKEITGIIKLLPEETRTIVTLRYIDGFEPREIAAILGVSANVISVRLSRALNIVKERFSKQE